MVETASVTHVVESQHTARFVGSGDLDVLGTPVLLAWCEEATCAALDLPVDRTSVGVRVEIEHLAASPVGMTVTVTAHVLEHTDRRASFAVSATDAAGTELCRGRVERAVVDRERFLARLPRVGD
ncbi:MAG TPA: hotdog domain-containing protein [Aeromicrobium sp.]|nr:hotdog domain-containing protein [Aeromicrobium sp.]